MRRLAPCLLLLAVTACGGERDEPPQAAPSPTITVERARAVAKAGVLKPADVPGYRVPDDGRRAEGIRGGTCLRGQLRPLASESAVYQKGTTRITSGVDVAQTRAAANAHVAYFASEEFPPCLERVLMADFANEQFSVTGYKASEFPVRVPGATVTFGYLVRMTAKRDGGRAPLTVYYVGAARGHAEAAVLATSAGADVFSPAKVTALLATSLKRAAAKEPG